MRMIFRITNLCAARMSRPLDTFLVWLVFDPKGEGGEADRGWNARIWKRGLRSLTWRDEACT